MEDMNTDNNYNANEVPTGQYAPISAWSYFGLSVLYVIPIVGFIFLIIHSCSDSNINRRNFARSHWCSLILTVIILAIASAVLGGVSVMLNRLF